MSKLFCVIEKDNNTHAESQLFHALGFNEPYPYAHFYAPKEASRHQLLRLTPISINTTHNDALLIGAGATLDITQEEHSLISKVLAKHLVSYEMTIFPLSSTEWLLSHEKCIKTTPLDKVLNQSLYPLLPEGEEKAFWHRLMTECQMLFFQTTTLQDRQDKFPINGVWFWGEWSGEKPNLYQTIITDDRAILACEDTWSGLTLVEYKGALDKSLLDVETPSIIYVSSLSLQDKTCLKKRKYRKKIKWQVDNDHLSLGHQDENNKKKNNKRLTKPFSLISSLSSHLCCQRDKYTKRFRNRP